jgi:hypothetical protein
LPRSSQIDSRTNFGFKLHHQAFLQVALFTIAAGFIANNRSRHYVA